MSRRWTTVTSVEAIPENGFAGFTIDGREIGIYHIGEQYHALENICPHAWVSLSAGDFDGWAIQCPIHAARFSVINGRRLSGPVCRDLRVYPVKLEDGVIVVDLEQIPITRFP